MILHHVSDTLADKDLPEPAFQTIKIFKIGTKSDICNSLGELAKIHPNVVAGLHLDSLLYQVHLGKMPRVNVDIDHLTRWEHLNEKD